MVGPLSDVKEPSFTLLPAPMTSRLHAQLARHSRCPCVSVWSSGPRPTAWPFPSEGRDFSGVLCLSVCLSMVPQRVRHNLTTEQPHPRVRAVSLPSPVPGTGRGTSSSEAFLGKG